MKIFNYAALRTDGDKYEKGQLEAASMKKAQAQLESQGLLVINLSPVQQNSWLDIFKFATISRLEKIYFTRHLQTFLEAGMTLDVAVKIVAEQVTNKKFKEILWDVHQKIVQGQTLSEALSQHGQYFSTYYIKLIKVGEESGRLDNILTHLLEHQEREYELLTRVRSAMIYPTIIMIAALAVVVFMMTFVVPNISKILLSYGTDLPLTTKILIAISNFFVLYGWFLAGFLALLLVVLRIVAKKPRGKWFFEALAMKLPIVRRIVVEYNVARFTRSLATPILSGISVDRSFQLTAEACQNSHYQKSMLEAAKLVQKGVPISEILQGYPDLYPPNVTRTIEIGEKTGKFDRMISRLTIFYEKSVFNTFDNLSSVLEPFLIVGIGLIVCFIAVSILTPIWKFADTV